MSELATSRSVSLDHIQFSIDDSVSSSHQREKTRRDETRESVR